METITHLKFNVEIATQNNHNYRDAVAIVGVAPPDDGYDCVGFRMRGSKKMFSSVMGGDSECGGKGRCSVRNETGECTTRERRSIWRKKNSGW
ncbi:hypothetical protein KSP40_PGU001209 [Platanthera guangdongensis]|uniref:Uncharacterized protein n=1 Tax=Platanthera guangdongensis TaxID=2320717 RepID=A0ABR2N3B6_9ASPA